MQHPALSYIKYAIKPWKWSFPIDQRAWVGGWIGAWEAYLPLALFTLETYALMGVFPGKHHTSIGISLIENPQPGGWQLNDQTTVLLECIYWWMCTFLYVDTWTVNPFKYSWAPIDEEPTGKYSQCLWIYAFKGISHLIFSLVLNRNFLIIFLCHISNI